MWIFVLLASMLIPTTTQPYRETCRKISNNRTFHHTITTCVAE